MRIKNSDMVLYSLYELKRSSNAGTSITRKDVSRALNIKDSSLNVYLSKLARDGLIIRKKRHFKENLAKLTDITSEGMDRIRMISETIDRSYFTPERHKIPSCIAFMDLYNNYSHPLERIFLLHLYMRKYSFDLYEYIENLATAKNDTSVAGYFRSMEKAEHPGTPYTQDVFKLTLYGSPDEAIRGMDGYDIDDVNSMIIHSESLVRRGKLEDAEMILGFLLYGDVEKDRNQLFQIIISLSKLYMKKGETERAMHLLNKTRSETKDRLLLACLESIEGSLMVDMERYDEGLKKLSSALRSFKALKNPHLSMITHNNRGVIYFLRGEFSTAEKEWLLARKYSKEIKNKNVEAVIKLNIADIEIKKGEFENAERILRSSERFLKKTGDLEGLSALYFNMALLEIAKRKTERALDFHELSESIAFPLPSPWSRKIRRKEIIDRCLENGLDPIIENDIQ